MDLKIGVCQMVVVFFMVEWCLANSVFLNVTGTGCNSCKLYTNIPCSSVKVDGTEYSNQYDGVTIVVIDTINGHISNKYFKPLQNVGKATIDDFKNFIMEINNHSVIAAISQGKCTLKRSWFHYISDYIHLDGEISLNYAEINVAIFCKGICPQPLKGKLPYSYFGSGNWHHVSIQLPMKELPTISKTETIFKLPLIIGVTTGSICLLVASILFIMVRKKRAKSRRSTSCEDSRYDGIESTTPPVKVNLQQQSDVTENDLSPSYQPLNGIHTPSEYSSLQIHITNELTGTSKDDYEYLYVTEQAENDYYESNRKEANDDTTSTVHDYLTLYPYVVSSSPGSSHQIFKKSMNIINREQSVRKETFASYITLEEAFKEGAVYKKPSNMPKFDPPIPMPKNVQRDSYLNMEEQVYHNSLYQPLSGEKNISTEYEVLRPET